MELLRELRADGRIKAGTKWMEVLAQIESDPRYVAMLGQPGSTPLPGHADNDRTSAAIG